MVRKLTLKDLIERLETPGWRLVTDDDDKAKADTSTLKDVLETTHRRRDTGALIKQVETTVELDMIQIQQLWQHLGLPMV